MTFFERYVDAHTYVSRHQLVSQLAFDVTVWRAPIQDEERRQRVAKIRVHWADRRPGPCDLCKMAKGGRHDDAILNFLVDHPGNTAADKLAGYLKAPFRDLPRMENRDFEQLEATSVIHVFTRNEADGFFNTEEELVSEVEPPQDITPLHRMMVLGQATHPRGAVPGGTLDGAGPGAGTAGTTSGGGGSPQADGGAPAEGTAEGDAPRGPKHNPAFFVMVANGHTTFHGEQQPPSWVGREHVLMTLREKSDGQFVAKPSLGVDHVVHVDDAWILWFRIDVASRTPAEQPSVKGPRKRSSGASEVTGSPNLTASGSRQPTDAQALELQSEALDTQKRMTILRQLLGTGAGGGSSVPVQAGGRSARADRPQFTLAPPGGAYRRHWFGTVDIVKGVDESAVFVQLSWVLPPVDFELDTDTNQLTGTACPLERTSQTALASRYRLPNGLYETRYHLNFPFELHGVAPVSAVGIPRLVIAVWSTEGEKRQALHGYGTLTMPTEPGSRVQEVQLWRPKLHGREDLRNIFVGGSTSLVHAEDAAIPYERRADNLRALADAVPFHSAEASLAANNRAGLITESTGSVVVRLMSAVQRRAPRVGGADTTSLRSRYAR